MGIDGRTLAKKPEDTDAYTSSGVGLLAHALVWVPLLLVIWFAYVSGTWIGGTWGGVLSVVSTLATVGLIWVWNKVRRRRR
jgi:Flp pilus assembly protein TadB